MIYAVTGSTGALGTLVINSLLRLNVPASSIVALARNEAKAANLKAMGVQIRLADYENPSSYEEALRGIDRLLLISGLDLGKRITQHQTVINAAKAAEVKLLVYTSMAHADTSSNPLAIEHKATEDLIYQAKIPFAVIRENWFHENYIKDLLQAKESGFIEAAVGAGKVASASCIDYAEAAAQVLIGEDQSGKIYELTGTYAWDYNELATIASELLGQTVTYHSISIAETKQKMVAAGMPEGIGDFVAALNQSIEAGSLASVHDDLTILISRNPKSLKETLSAALAK